MSTLLRAGVDQSAKGSVSDKVGFGFSFEMKSGPSLKRGLLFFDCFDDMLVVCDEHKKKMIRNCHKRTINQTRVD